LNNKLGCCFKLRVAHTCPVSMCKDSGTRLYQHQQDAALTPLISRGLLLIYITTREEESSSTSAPF